MLSSERLPSVHPKTKSSGRYRSYVQQKHLEEVSMAHLRLEWVQVTHHTLATAYKCLSPETEDTAIDYYND